MRSTSLTLFACLAAAACGCARTITVGHDPEPAPAQEKPVEPRRYRVSLPPDNTIYTPMYLDMLKALDEGVGYEMLLLPAPLFEATTEFRWMKVPAEKTAADDLCRATPSETDDPAWGAFKIELSVAFAKTFWNSPTPVKDTKLYRVFLHCIGHALAFSDVTGPGDVMSTPLDETADLKAFYDRVRALNHPAP